MADDNRQESERKKNLKNDYRAVFMGASTRSQGLRVLRDVLQATGVFMPCVGHDDRQTNFLLGKRDAGLNIMELLDVRGYDGLREMERHNLGISDMFLDPFDDKERSA